VKAAGALHARWRIALVSSSGAIVYRGTAAPTQVWETPGAILTVPAPSGERDYPVLAALPAKVDFSGLKAQNGDIGLRRATARVTAAVYPPGRPLRLLVYEMRRNTAVLRYNGAVVSVRRSADSEEWSAESGFGGATVRMTRAEEVFGNRATRPRDPLPVIFSAGEYSGGPGTFPTTLIFEEPRPAGPGDDFAALHIISEMPLAEVVAVYENGVRVLGDPLVIISANDPAPLDPDFSAFGPPMAWVFFRRRPLGTVTVDARSIVVSPIGAVQDFVALYAGWTRFDPANAAKDAQLAGAGIRANSYFANDAPLGTFLRRWKEDTGLEAVLTPEMTLRLSAREPRTLVRKIEPEVHDRQLRGRTEMRFDPEESPREVLLACNYAWARRVFTLTARHPMPHAPNDARILRLERKAIWMTPVAAQVILDDLAPSFSGHSLSATVAEWDGDAMEPGRIATVSGETVELDALQEEGDANAVRVSGRMRTSPVSVPGHPLPLSVVARVSLSPMANCDEGTANVRADPAQPVYFRACADGGTGAFQYSWNFGDGSTAPGTTATHAYATSGRFNARVTVTDLATGDTASAFAVVVAQAPLLAWGLLWRCTGAPYRRTHESDTVVPPTAFANATGWADGDISGEWDWGDGSPPTPGFRALHEYAFQNIPFMEYGLVFRVRRGAELFQDANPRMVVQEPFASGGRAVRATVSMPGEIRATCIHREHRWYTDSLPLTLEFSAQLQNWTMPVLAWVWGDGTANGAGSPVAHAFANYGNYLVRAVVSEGGGPPVVTDVLRVVIRARLALQAEASINDGAWVALPATLSANAGHLVRVRTATVSGGDGTRVVRWRENGTFFAFGDELAFYVAAAGTRVFSADVADEQGAIEATNAARESQDLTLEVA
jgi:hypothetical protein